jgi:PAS domain S-box-containing protein
MERLNSIVQSTGALFLLADRELNVVMANNGFLRFVGLTEAQAVGQPLKDIMDCPLERSVIDRWLAAGIDDRLEPAEYDNTPLDRAGERRTLHVTANPVRGESGRVEHIVFLAVDETERRRTELQLFDTSRLATLGEMASGIAHEINQPLTVIRFAAESLLEEITETPDDARLGDSRDFVREKCTRVIAQTERASTIIRDLRGFARKPDDTADTFDVTQALRAAGKMVEEQLRLARIELDRDLDPACPPVVGHASRLQQVIINLLLNARDSILDRQRAGEPVGTITVRLRSPWQSGTVVITVEDDGPGIPDRVLPRLFEPFFTTKPPGKGTGLGLSISYQIIRQMGGRIVAENRAEGGARFTITLDAARTAPVAAAAE